MGSYQEAFRQLNPAQKQAVETIDGPVLVIAGPGTGKTQLLTTRIAHILATTDTLPQNILCLTFTDSAAQTMRDRLSGLIGQGAYDVAISTYHAFGSDLIRQWPEYFAEEADLRPADDLTIDRTLREIVNALPYSNPLKYSDAYLGDIKTLISDAKRALLGPDDLRAIAKDNLHFITAGSPVVQAALSGVARIDKKATAAFSHLAKTLHQDSPDQDSPDVWKPLGVQFVRELRAVLDDVADTGKTTSLTAWKNSWLAKDDNGNFVVDGAKANQKLLAAADVYEHYLHVLKQRGLFDYDDMILRAVHALEANTDFRLSLQERYQYLLLDEFQDTNGAQLRIVELLTDNPVNEGRPNVLAVGDDDQAIYAFQGASYSHMLRFAEMYRGVVTIPLTQNYRSHPDILHTAGGVAGQIEERLHYFLSDIQKTLTAANPNLPKGATVERREARSDVMEYAWVTKKITDLIASGLPPHEIAVLAPQHKYLEPLVPFLQQENIPVRYDKRENVLNDPAVNQLLRMSELALALAQGNQAAANALWAQVLSFDFWELPTSTIWRFSWQASDGTRNWTDELLENEDLRPIALFFIRLGFLAGTESLEAMLDYIIGVTPLDLKEPTLPKFTSPYYNHYFGELTQAKEPSSADSRDSTEAESITPDNKVSLFDAPHAKRAPSSVSGDSTQAEPEKQPGRPAETVGSPAASTARERSPETDEGGRDTEKGVSESAQNANFWSLLTNLIVLRARLREYHPHEDEQLLLADFIDFAEAHRAADLKILNTSPYASATDAVQIMTTYKAKGMEFGAVFVLAANDEVWGGKARTQSMRISLPPNLQFMRYAGATGDERLRLLYVAVTRAKTQLYLVSHTQNYAGKIMTRLKYLSESADEEGVVTSPLLPTGKQIVLPAEDGVPEPTTELAAYWRQRHEIALSHADMRALLEDRLAGFQLSPTHLGDFTDLAHAGPQSFFLRTILRFPQTPWPEMQYGNAVHETLEWLHHQAKASGKVPPIKSILAEFRHRMQTKRLNAQDAALFTERGEDALTVYIQQRDETVAPNNVVEHNFKNEGVFAGKAHLSGKIDKMIIDKQAKTITIVDYKTGKAHARWSRDVKLHKYRQQLYFYKLLIEGSHSYGGYRVTDAYLEFVEPDEAGKIQELHLEFNDTEYQHLKKLAEAVWQRITNLDLPDTTAYTPDLAGIELFETDLLQ